MRDTPLGPVPFFARSAPDLAEHICPAYRLSYPDLYRFHYGRTPESWLLGAHISVRVGFASHGDVRRRGASGGVITATLCHLLDSGAVDAVVAVRQGVPKPDQARSVICRTPEEILDCAQSVYVPVSVLDRLRDFEPGMSYAMTVLPDQAAALRAMQRLGVPAALQVKFLLGPYTGTALYPAAIASFLRSHGIRADDEIVDLQWRAGEWPGYLEIRLASGRVLRSPKVYYNYLIPFFITRNSLQNMDFSNEFCDLSVGDAWSPVHEATREATAVFTTRTAAMEEVIVKMIDANLLTAEMIDPLKASEMHGHMLDFKKRGSYIRNRFRQCLGRRAPDYGMRPQPLPLSRVGVELIISLLFFVCGSCPARWFVAHVPEHIIGPLFNRLRLSWKAVSRPTKRKGLANLTMEEIVRGANDSGC